MKKVGKVKNDRGAGRKPNGYESKKISAPIDLIPSFKAQIERYKLKGDNNAKLNDNETD